MAKAPVEKQQLEIRPATMEDTPAILGLIKELAEYEHLSHQVVATEEGLRESLFGPQKAAEVFLGFVGEEPVCFTLFFSNFSTFLGRSGLYIEDLYVKEAYRCKGYARKLVQAVAILAKERQCTRVEWAVLNWNEPAIRFYQKLGAKPLEAWMMYRISGKALDAVAE